MLEIITYVLGPVVTNTYLVADEVTREAVVIDPAWDEPEIINEARRRDWKINQLWITHAHFDHIGGVAGLYKQMDPKPILALHPYDTALWSMGGGAAMFGMRIPQPPAPTLEIIQGQELNLGKKIFEVRHVPGHSTGHVVFYCREAKVVFCGDTVFLGSIGRTDLAGGDEATLLKYIRERILDLPDDTRLLCGHGEETTVGQERRWNPFLAR